VFTSLRQAYVGEDNASRAGVERPCDPLVAVSGEAHYSCARTLRIKVDRANEVDHKVGAASAPPSVARPGFQYTTRTYPIGVCSASMKHQSKLSCATIFATSTDGMPMPVPSRILPVRSL
jgi:hypothetical protein